MIVRHHWRLIPHGQFLHQYHTITKDHMFRLQVLIQTCLYIHNKLTVQLLLVFLKQWVDVQQIFPHLLIRLRLEYLHCSIWKAQNCIKQDGIIYFACNVLLRVPRELIISIKTIWFLQLSQLIAQHRWLMPCFQIQHQFHTIQQFLLFKSFQAIPQFSITFKLQFVL